MMGNELTHSGKKTCPHLGQEFQPFVKPQLDDPYSFYKLARNQEPIFFSPLFNTYVLTRYDDILAVLKDPARFSSASSIQSITDYTPETVEVLRQGFPFVSLINSDGEQHKRLRAPFVRMFAPEKLATIEDMIRAIANRLVDAFIQNGNVEILSQFAYPLTLEVILTMYGIPLESMTEVKQCGSDMTALFSTQLTPERQVECARSFISLQNFIAGLIEERSKEPRQDFVSEVLNSDLNMGESVLLLCEMILAGHKTTANLIGNALKILLQHPQYWQTLCQDRSLVSAVLEEVLRYDSPALAMVRLTTEEVSVAGMTLPKDSRVMLLYGSANHDEAKYKDGDRFELERFQHKVPGHLAFSYGMHHCLGSNLARREGRIALEVLSQRLPNLKLRLNQDLTHIPTMLNRGYTQLYLAWEKQMTNPM
ncbi:MAG: cytochrome P450 [Xenococcaceae cyanobacterium]